MLTKQQLLIPRVLCIGGKEGDEIWPNSSLKVGEILTATIDDEGRPYIRELSPCLYFEDIEKFHNLFKPLRWFEMRDKSDLPTYVNYVKNGRIYKAVWDCFKFKGEKEWSLILQPNGIPINPDGFTPADESDFQEYQKQKQ